MCIPPSYLRGYKNSEIVVYSVLGSSGTREATFPLLVQQQVAQWFVQPANPLLSLDGVWLPSTKYLVSRIRHPPFARGLEPRLQVSRVGPRGLVEQIARLYCVQEVVEIMSCLMPVPHSTQSN